MACTENARIVFFFDSYHVEINTEELLQVNLRTLVDNMLFTYNIGNGIRPDDTIKFSKVSYQKLLTQYEKNTPIATPHDRELFLGRLLLLFLRYNTGVVMSADTKWRFPKVYLCTYKLSIISNTSVSHLR